MAPWRKDISLGIYPYVKNTQMPVTEGQVIFASAPLHSQDTNAISVSDISRWKRTAYLQGTSVSHCR